MSKIKIGCCGFPKGIKKYFTEFDTVEVQKTFYQPVSLQSIEKWFKQAPLNFEFTIKAFQGITHPTTSPTYMRLKKPLPGNLENYGFFRQTDEVYNAWKETEKIALALHVKYILFQCPSSFKPTDENLENITSFFNKISNSRYHFVWEPRGVNWTDDIILEICEKCNLIHCVDPFKQKPVTKNIAYFRLHGKPPGEKMYYYSYSKEDLKKLYEHCKNFRETYCFFNNIDMYKNALKFKEIVSNFRG